MATINITGSMNLGLPPQPAVTTATADTAAAKTLTVTPGGGSAIGDGLFIEVATDAAFTNVIQSNSKVIDAGVLASGYTWTTAALAAGAYYARVIQSRLHGSGAVVYSAHSATLTLICQLVVASAPAISNTTLNLGRLTRTGVAFAQLVSFGGAITGEGGPNTIAGTGASHFQISSTGEISVDPAAPTSSPTGALNSSYSLTVTVFNSSGSASAALTINTEAQAYDAATTAQVQAAAQHAKANNPLLASKVYIRDGVTLGDFNTSVPFQGSSYAFPGTFSHPNSGTTDEVGYNRNAQATISGGSCELTCRTPYSVKLMGVLSFTGASGFIINGLTICRHFITPPVKTGSGPATAGTSYYSLSITKTATHSTRGNFIVRNCHIGGMWDPASTEELSVVGMSILNANAVSVEDCEFYGVMNAINVGAVDYFHCTRISTRKVIQDNIACRGINGCSIDPVIRKFSDITYFDKVELNPLFAGAHGDFIQFGTWSDRLNVHFFIGWCYDVRSNQGIYIDDCAGQWLLGDSYPASEACIWNGHFYTRTSLNDAASQAAAGTAAAEPGVGASWQTYWVDQGVTANTEIKVDGKVYRTFAMTIATATFTAHRGLVTYDRCTAISDPFRPDASTEARFVAYKNPGGIVTNSIGGKIVNLQTGIFTPTNYQAVVKDNEATYFTGPFTDLGGSAPQPVLDLTNASTVRASIDAAYLPKAGYTTMGHLAA